mmetsp:Transcript_19910/g.46706  ORF Transcript_19910/g.46706 Transcript_19910/m.46706 type:complete len:715 (-) Transcript_19910:699-2843(-)|eukprot:CAMPEP_0197186812 /NCGR_PEP_ID=MMETSP1423-20130617/14643_1 /TAXON_ID=476441 /ORGANISM="Pseudo-nitzschia heimii, Strain UNC1101" /LENGTH=714 /DNA_ID=CAMNT_0042638223 /DNA_START=179 /DNA_END=2323 /DNA_ORIENTATION=+
MSSVDKNISNIAFTRTVLGVFFCIIVLAVDELNPVKLLFHVFPSIRPWHLASAAAVCSLYVIVSEFKELLYFGVTMFFNSMLSIFFREIEVIGKDRLPRHGPMIFTINHANQFVDAMVVISTCRKEEFKISLLMAEKSFNRPVIGEFASALDVVPVKRAQDDAIRGLGSIIFETAEPSSPSAESLIEVVVDSAVDNTTTNGDAETNETSSATGVRKLIIRGTDGFSTSAFKVGDKLRPMGTPTGVKVLEILDETCCLVDASSLSESDRDTVFATGADNSRGYDILKHVPLQNIFGKVLDRLAMGGVFGIFPEGGSHDRTDLLPLKAGVALIAYSALERDGISVPIVPVGLNYFRTHRWRGKCLVEYGDPVYLKPGSLKEFQKGGAAKRAVCNDLLDRIQESMRSVIVTMPDYDSLQLVQTARRLYQRNSLVNGKEKQDLLRRFAVGYKVLVSLGGDNPPQDWIDIQEGTAAYRKELRELGLQDYQVIGLDRDKENDDRKPGINKGIRIVYRIMHLLVLMALSAIPNIFLNLPVRLMADVWAERRRKKALARSKVKLHGYDVMLTEKILFCIVCVPLLWFLYGLIMIFFTNFDGRTITLCFMCFPVFSYASIISSEAGMVDGKELKPYLLRLLPSTRRRLRALPQKRRELQRDLRAFIKMVGPAFGELYHGKSVDWTQINHELSKKTEDIMKKSNSTDDFHHVESINSMEQKKEK